MAIVVPIVSEWNPKGLDKSMSDIQRAEGGWAKAGVGMEKALLPATAALAGIAVAAFSWVKEAETAQQSMDRLTATLGNVSGVTDKAIQRQADLASEISKVAGVTDDEIMAGQAILATFHSVASSADTVGGAFDRATQAGVDLAAAGFGTIEGNATSLGKALENPTKGMTALAKSGVTFTDAQKDQIAAMQESGDLLGAQDVLLKAVESQVQGTAAATATESSKMTVAFGELQESLGTALLPAFEKLTGFVTRFADQMGKSPGPILAVTAAVAGLSVAIIAINAAMKAYQTIALIVTAIQNAQSVQFALAAVRLYAYQAAMLVVEGATKAWAAVQWLLNAAMSANPIGLVIIAIVALVAIFVIAWNKSETFRNIVIGAWEAIKRAATSLWQTLKAAFRAGWDFILAIFGYTPLGFLINNFDVLKRAAQSAVDFVKGAFQGLWDFLKRLWQKIKDLFSGGIVGKAIGAVTGNAATASYASPSLYGAPTATSFAAAASPVQITVTGAVDPERTARQIRRLLDQSDVRQGRTRQLRAVSW